MYVLCVSNITKPKFKCKFVLHSLNRTKNSDKTSRPIWHLPIYDTLSCKNERGQETILSALNIIYKDANKSQALIQGNTDLTRRKKTSHVSMNSERTVKRRKACCNFHNLDRCSYHHALTTTLVIHHTIALGSQ